MKSSRYTTAPWHDYRWVELGPWGVENHNQPVISHISTCAHDSINLTSEPAARMPLHHHTECPEPE